MHKHCFNEAYDKFCKSNQIRKVLNFSMMKFVYWQISNFFLLQKVKLHCFHLTNLNQIIELSNSHVHIKYDEYVNNFRKEKYYGFLFFSMNNREYDETFSNISMQPIIVALEAK